MPKTTITQETRLSTRNNFTHVDAVVSLTVDGREIPTMAVLGLSLEEAVAKIQDAITESYKAVPARV